MFILYAYIQIVMRKYKLIRDRRRYYYFISAPKSYILWSSIKKILHESHHFPSPPRNMQPGNNYEKCAGRIFVRPKSYNIFMYVFPTTTNRFNMLFQYVLSQLFVFFPRLLVTKANTIPTRSWRASKYISVCLK